MKPDAVVVGAGPAGSASALKLARAGAKVLLVDRARFPREKPCGDGLTPRALAALDELGIGIERTPLVRHVVAHAAGDSARRVDVELNAAGTVLARAVLDERLAQQAASAGAAFRTLATVEALVVEDRTVRGVRIRSPSGRSELVLAPITILAEGSAQALGRQAPIPPVRGRRSGFALRRYLSGVEWTGPPAFEIWLPLESNGAPVFGYGWAFPDARGLANLGVGWLDRPTPKIRIDGLLEGFEDMLRRTDPRFASARPETRPTGAPVLIGGSKAACFAPGLLVVGDAAGLANPLWAEGVALALESGSLAADTALSRLAGSAPLSAFGDALMEQAPLGARLASSLPSLYRSARRVSRDIAAFLCTETKLSRSVLSMMEAEATHSPLGPPAAEGTDPLLRAADAAGARARRLAGRDRPFFGELVVQLERLEAEGPRAARVFLATRACFPELDLADRGLRRAAVCLDLLARACLVLDDVPAATDEDDGTTRGGAWLAASIALHLGDRLLSRLFALASRLDPLARVVMSDAAVEVFEAAAGAATAAERSDAARLRRAIYAAAARAGARLAGADASLASDLAAAAAGADWTSASTPPELEALVPRGALREPAASMGPSPG